MNSLTFMIIEYFYILFWNLTYKVSCISLFLIFIPIFFMFKYDFMYRIRKKECFASCFLEKSSFLYSLFTRRVFSFIGSMISLFLLNVVLFFSIIYLDFLQKLILFFDIFLLYGMYRVVKFKFFADEVRDIFIINYISFLNAILLVIIFLVWNLFQPIPDFIVNDMYTTLQNYSQYFSSECDFLNVLVKYGADFYAISWWFFVKGFVNSSEWLRVVLVILFLGGGFAVFYQYGRFLLLNMKISMKIFGGIDGKE